jgi:hypothetical protein
MTSFTTTLDTTEVDEFTRALPREIFNATRSAIRTTTTFAEKELEKRMAEATQIPIKAFKVFRVLSKSSDVEGRIWFGLQPMRARFVGKIEESTDGATAGNYFFKGTGDHYFIAKLGSVNSIWKRRGKDRFPVTEAKVNLINSERITAAVADIAEEELITRFTKKLNAYIEKRESAA